MGCGYETDLENSSCISCIHLNNRLMKYQWDSFCFHFAEPSCKYWEINCQYTDASDYLYEWSVIGDEI